MDLAKQRPGAWLEHLGGRKYSVVIIVILVASVGLFIGKLDGSQWLGAVGLAVSLYNLANAATHWSARPTVDAASITGRPSAEGVDPGAE